MDAFLKQFQELKIQPEEIRLATNNFGDENYIGGGGFGKVYKGEVSHSKGRSMAAIKRLDLRRGQGTPEFLKEIIALSRYNHQNIISLLGFCNQGDEMILVYEHASRGSLDRHLNSPHLKWSQRLQICLDVAKGLSYLHDPRETHQRLIHCDIKSSNILLDDQWNAKVSDFGLSIMGPANEQQSVIVTLAAGTPGYCDPQYEMTHTLTKESDVYSFGVVLFEVLCGKLCCTYSNGRVQQNLVPTWIESYRKYKLKDIIFKNATTNLDQSSLITFSNIAYRCLNESREDRPKMVEVVTELEGALHNQKLCETQEFIEWKEQLFYYEELVKSAIPPLNYHSDGELWKLLSRGVLLNGSKTWFSLNKKGEHCEIISFEKCLKSAPKAAHSRWNDFKSSSAIGTYFWDYDHKDKESVIIRVKAEFLSLGVTYTVNLILKSLYSRGKRNHDRISLRYKLQGETKTSVSYLMEEREDGWWACELYQFTSDQRSIDLEIIFEGYYDCHIFIEAKGIEFRPLEKVEHKDEKQPVSDSVANWDEKLPTDYKDMMKWSIDCVQWTTKIEAYSILRKGFLINDGQTKWFSLDKNGKKCHMISTKWSCIADEKYPLSLPESRFGRAVVLKSQTFSMVSNIESRLVSHETTYASYLIYKLPEDQSGFEAPMEVEDQSNRFTNCWYIYFTIPQTPVIRPKAEQNTHNPFHRTKRIGLPQQRNDGWMEVKIWEFQSNTTSEMIRMRLQLQTCGYKELSGLIVQGIEFRPI